MDSLPALTPKRCRTSPTGSRSRLRQRSSVTSSQIESAAVTTKIKMIKRMSFHIGMFDGKAEVLAKLTLASEGLAACIRLKVLEGSFSIGQEWCQQGNGDFHEWYTHILMALLLKHRKVLQ